MMPRKTPTEISEIPTEIFKIPTEISETVGVFSRMFSGFTIRFPFSFLFRDPVVYLRPSREAAYLLVVDVTVGVDLACVVAVEGEVRRLVGVDSVEGNALLQHPVDGLLQPFAPATGPQDEIMAVGFQLVHHLHGVGLRGAYLRVGTHAEGTVEINSDDHDSPPSVLTRFTNSQGSQITRLPA